MGIGVGAAGKSVRVTFIWVTIGVKVAGSFGRRGGVTRLGIPVMVAVTGVTAEVPMLVLQAASKEKIARIRIEMGKLWRLLGNI